jgi:hypothetical protein
MMITGSSSTSPQRHQAARGPLCRPRVTASGNLDWADKGAASIAARPGPGQSWGVFQCEPPRVRGRPSAVVSCLLSAAAFGFALVPEGSLWAVFWGNGGAVVVSPATATKRQCRSRPLHVGRSPSRCRPLSPASLGVAGDG